VSKISTFKILLYVIACESVGNVIATILSGKFLSTFDVSGKISSPILLEWWIGHCRNYSWHFQG
jgi:hypothetical protein